MMKNLCVGCFVCIALALQVQAERLAVSNPGFDFRTYPSGGTNTHGYTTGAGSSAGFVPLGGGSDNAAVVSGWQSAYVGGGPSTTVGAHHLNSTYWLPNNYPGSGNAAGYSTWGGLLIQTLTNALQPNTAYRLQVDLLARESGLPAQSNVVAKLQDGAGNDLAGALAVVMPSSAGPGSATYTVMTSSNASPGNLRIVLGNSNTNTYSQICFDSVRLDAGVPYSNQIIGYGQDADPGVLRHNGVSYVYSGNYVFKSWDMVNWDRGSMMLTNILYHGSASTYYNPSNQTFYYYYQATNVIGVATNSSPEGPFVDLGLLITNAIDPELFVDDDGTRYLYYTTVDGIFVNKITDPTHLGTGTNNLLCVIEAEAPAVLKHNGIYYLIWSYNGAGWPTYQMGYATASNPMGPWTPYAANPFISRSTGVYGPGSCDVTTDDAGNPWLVYHQQMDDQFNWNRFVCLDPLWFDVTGGLHGQATRGLAQPAPILTITRQPQDQLVDASQSAVFTITAKDPMGGTVAYNYKWFKLVNGTNDIQVGTNTTLSYPAPLSAANEGTYYCRVYSNSLPVAVSAPAKLAIKGLVGHWKFDGNTTDASGFGNNGTALGSPSYVAGVNGTDLALALDGVDQAVSIPTAVWNRITANAITISLWQFGDGSQPQIDSIFSAYTLEKRVAQAHVPYADGNVHWHAGNATKTFDYTFKAAVPANYKGQWNHWVFTKDVTSGEMKIYLNGQPWHQASGCFQPIGTPTSIYIGSGQGQEFYAGLLEDFRIYNYVLNSNQVAQIYQQTLASAITWTTPATITAPSDISTNGTLLAAYSLNNGGGTLNGVTFANSGGGSLGSYISMSPPGFGYAGFGGGTATPYANLPVAYQTLIANGRYGGPFTITLTNLTVGHQYQVQLWCNDSRGYNNGGNDSSAYNSVSGEGNTVQVQLCSTGAQGGLGQSTIGTFVAFAASQNFTVTGGNYQSADTYVNAIQLRDLGAFRTAGYWNGLQGSAWDSSTTANWSTNLAAAPLGPSTFSQAMALSGGTAVFADSYYANGTAQPVTQSTVTVAAGGVSATTVNFQSAVVNYTVSGADSVGITGTTAVNKNGTSTLTLSGQNTYTGGTIVNQGILYANGPNSTSGAIGNGNVSVNNGGIIRVGGDNSFVGGLTSGGRTITINSGGVITNTASSCHLNALVMNGGTLAAATANSLFGNWNFDYGVSTPGNGSSSSIVGGNAALTEVGGTVFNIGTGDTLTVSAALNRVSDGGVPDTGLIKSGAGTLALSAVNTYAGKTSVNAGVLTITGAGQLGGGSYSGLVSNNGALNYNSSAAQTLSGIISGTGALIQSGPGTLTLTAQNTFTGGTTVNQGVLYANAPNSLYGALGYGNVTVNNGGTIRVGGDNSFVGGATSGAKTITINAGGTITNTSSSCHLNALVMNGGTLRAAVANSFFGNWNLDCGVSTPGNGSSSLIVGGNAALTQVGGTVFNIGTGDTLTVSAALNHVSDGGVPDTGLKKSGTGALILSGTNTYTGATTVSTGRLVVVHPLAVPPGSITVAAGAAFGVRAANFSTAQLDALIATVGWDAGGTSQLVLDTGGGTVVVRSSLTGNFRILAAGGGTLNLTGGIAPARVTAVEGTTVIYGVIPPQLPVSGFSLPGGVPTFQVPNTVLGYQYQLVCKTNLIEAIWTPVGTTQNGTGGTLTFTDPTSPMPSQRFYRLQAQ